MTNITSDSWCKIVGTMLLSMRDCSFVIFPPSSSQSATIRETQTFATQQNHSPLRAPPRICCIFICIRCICICIRIRCICICMCRIWFLYLLYLYFCKLSQDHSPLRAPPRNRPSHIDFHSIQKLFQRSPLCRFHFMVGGLGISYPG